MHDASLCRLCLTAATAITQDHSKIVRCFGPSDIANQTVADVLNTHFWFKLLTDRDHDTFVCQPCWHSVATFHQFYQTVLNVYENVANFCAVNVDVAIADDAAAAADADAVEPKFNISDVLSTGIKPESLRSGQRNKTGESDQQLGGTIKVEAPPADDDDDEDYAGDAFNRDDSTDEDSSGDEVLASVAAKPTKKKPALPAAAASSSPPKPKKRKSTKPPTAAAGKKKPTEGKVFADDQLLLKYMPIMCYVCALSFKKYVDLTRHNRKVHDNRTNVLRCCDRNFSQKSDALEHCRWHENPTHLDCTQCEKSFLSIRSLRDHVAHKHTIGPGSERRYACTQCTRAYPTQPSLKHHIKRVHGEHRFECFDCHRCFSYKSALLLHMDTQHRTAEEAAAQPEAPYVCAVCARLYKTRATYNEHFIKQHTTEPAAVAAQCPDCGKWMKNKHALKAHLSLHRDLNPPPCEVCGFQAVHKRGADEHRRKMHSAYKPTQHPCLVCGRVFLRPAKLKQHMAIHMDTHLFQCPYCPKTFRFDSLLYTHRKRVHAAELEADRRAADAERAEQSRQADAAIQAIREERQRQRQALGVGEFGPGAVAAAAAAATVAAVGAEGQTVGSENAAV